jgi:hypothetical protein
MTKAKAMLYKTAMIAVLFDETNSDFKQGDFVRVEFVGRGAFGWNFKCSKADGSTACFSENELERFVL